MSARSHHSPQPPDSAGAWRGLVDALPQCIGVYAAVRDDGGRIIDFRIEYVNEAACRSHGISSERQVGRRLNDLRPSYRESGLFADFCKVVDTGEPCVRDAVVLTDVFEARVQTRKLRLDARRRDDGVLATWTDVTGQDDVAEALRLSEERYAALFESLDQAFCVVEILNGATPDDLDMRFLEMNQAFEQHTGIEQAVGRRISELFPGIGSEHLRPYAEVLRTRTPARFERYLEHLGRHIDAYAFPFGGPDQNQVAILFTDISEQKRIDEALRESEQRFRSMADHLPLIVWLHDADGKLRFVNETYCQYFGVTREEALSDRWRALTHPDDSGRYIREFDGCIRNRRPFHAEVRIRRADGQWRWIESWGRPRFDADGGFRGIVGTSVDVTIRKHVEETLRIRARQQQSIAEMGELALREPDLQVVLDSVAAMAAETLEVEYCKVLEILSDRDELLLRAGVGWRDGLVGEAIVGTTLDSQAGHTLRSDAPVICEDLREETRFAGPSILIDHGVVSGISCIIRGAAGRPWGVLGAHSRRRMVFTRDDVNFLLAAANVVGAAIDRRRADEALRESEHRFRQIADNVNVAFYVTDAPERRVRYISSAYTRLWGLDPRELRQDPAAWNSLIHHEDRDDAIEAYTAFLAGRGEYDREYRIILPDGDERWIHDRATVASRSADGSILRITGIAEDVTERKRNEERMQTILAELNHRVKNTLAVIQSIARQTVRRAPDLAAFSQGFERRLHSIANAHSLLTKSEWSGAPLREIVDSEVVSRTGSDAQCLIDGPHVNLRPKAALAVHMVVHELITNACKYGALKSEGGRLEIAWRIEGEKAPRLRLEWTEQTPHQVVAPNDEGYGSRLIEQLVEYELNGDVRRDFQSEGLRCAIEFPLSDAVLKRSASARGTRLGRREHGRVLLVEDNAMLAMSLNDELERAGYATIGPASTLDEAMNLVDAQPPCAAILDIELNGAKVYPLARRLRGSRIPFVLLTGYDPESLPADLRTATVITKPFIADDLSDFLDEHCSRAQVDEEPCGRDGGAQSAPGATSGHRTSGSDDAASVTNGRAESARGARSAARDAPSLRKLRHDIRNSIATIKLVLHSTKLKQQGEEAELLRSLDEEVRTMQRQFDTLVEHYAVEQPASERQ